MSEQAILDTAIGPLPADWSVVKLGMVSSEGTERNHNLDFGRADVLGVDNRTGLVPSDRLLGDDFSRYKLVRKHQFAYNPMRLNVGSIGLWSKDKGSIVSPDYIVFGCKPDLLDPDYMDLFRRSSTWKWQIQQSGQGSVRIRYYYRHIADFLIPLPSLMEQRAIAQVLRTVQQARGSAENIIAAGRQFKQSLMRHLYTFGPVQVQQADQVPLKETTIGPVPEHWGVVRLGDVVTETQYGLSKRGERQGRYPIFRMNNLSDGRLFTNHLQYVDLDEDEFAKFRLNQGDLLFNRTNSFELVGKTSLFDLLGEYVFASYLIRVTPDTSRLAPEFANYYLNLESSQARLKQLAARAVGQSNINATKLRDFQIALPPLDEQGEIAEQLEHLDFKIEAETTQKQAQDALFQSLLHHLMTGKVRVNGIDVPATAEAAPCQ
jgi:type I restriction enzyme S subunit